MRSDSRSGPTAAGVFLAVALIVPRGKEGFDAPAALAIDALGSVWIANCGGVCSDSGIAGSVTKLAPDGQSSSTFRSAGFSGPYAIALGGNNMPWIANALSANLTELNTDGSTAKGTLDAASLLYPVSVAIDQNGTAWTVSPGTNGVVAFTANGQFDAADSYQGAGLAYPYALAIDHSSRVWIANHAANSISVVASGTPVPGSPFTGGGLAFPNAIALDGGGNAWITNANNSVSEFSSAGLPLSSSTGISTGFAYPNGIAVDGSGNVWVTNCGAYCLPASSANGGVTQIVGAAVPVVTPLSVGSASNALATRP